MQPRAATKMARLLIILSVALYITVIVQAMFRHEPEDKPKRNIHHRAHYVNSWAVKIRGGSATADIVARQNEYENLGLVCQNYVYTTMFDYVSVVRRFRGFLTCITLES